MDHHISFQIHYLLVPFQRSTPTTHSNYLCPNWLPSIPVASFTRTTPTTNIFYQDSSYLTLGMSFIFHQQIDITLPVSSGVLSKAHNFFLLPFFLYPFPFGILAHTEVIYKTFFLHPSLMRWMLYIATYYCRFLIKFKQELKALAEAFVRNFPKFY